MHVSRRFILAGLLGLAAAPALAQGLGFGLGMHDVAARAGGGAAPPLDSFTAPSGAYSFRKLKSSYVGPAVKLQRVDTTTQDIGFTAAGDFDTAAAATFCTTACTVTTWYDQSGLGRHLIQATAANQPAYIASCNGSLPCLQATNGTQALTGPSVTPASGVVSFGIVANRSAGTGSCQWLRQNGPNNRWSSAISANTWQMQNTGSMTATANDNVWHAAQGIINGAASVLAIDGVEVTGTVTGNTTAGAMVMNGPASTTCSWVENIVWDAYVLTPAERTALTNNQRNYWMPAPLDGFTAPAGAYSFRKLKSTYAGPAMRIRRASDNAEIDINFLGCTPFTGCPWDEVTAAGHCVSTTCFGRTWYDQSGNARDLVQATTASQLQLIFNCDGTLPCWRATVNTQTVLGTSFTPASGVVSFSAVANRTVAGTGACIFLRENGTANRIQSSTTAGQWQVTGGTSGSVSAAAPDAAFHAAVGAITGAATSFLNIDGVTTTGTATGNTAAAGPGILGSATGTCDFGEAMWWDAYVVTAPEAAALIANQRGFWGTP